MAPLVITGEVLGALLLLAIVAVALLLVRRSRISRGGSLVLMAVRDGSRLHTGLARVAASEIAWFPLFGFHTRPRHRWERGELALSAPRDHDARPGAFQDPVAVTFELPSGDVEVVLGRADYTVVRSWSESAPPGLNANTVA